MSEKIFHVIEPIEDWNPNAVFGRLVEVFNFPEVGKRKLYLIFNTNKLYLDFIEKVLDVGTIWMVKRIKQPCQQPDKITYMLPNGMEVEILVLNNS